MYKDEEPEAMKALSQKIGKGLKTQEDLARFTKAMTQMSVEAALNAELDDHLGYEKGTPR